MFRVRCSKFDVLSRLLLALALFHPSSFILHPSAASAATNDLTSLLQQGLFEEEANRNLDAAITSYQSLAKKFDQDRQVAATAVFRLGECYRKLGRTNDAVAQYERIGREFPDHQTLATLSRQNLVGMGATTQNPSFPRESAVATPAPSAVLLKLQTEYAMLTAAIEQAKRETNLHLVAKQFGDDKLAEQFKDFTERSESYQRLPSKDSEDAKVSLLNVGYANNRVQKELQRVFQEAEFRIRVLASAIEQARGQSPTNALTSSAATVVTDEEEQEIRRIQAMIRNSPDLINAPSGEDKLTPLCRAAGKGQLRVAAFLLDNGAKVDSRNSSGETPLLLAAGSGHRSMVELLLSRGADVNARSAKGSTALHKAAVAGYLGVAEALLAHKAEVDLRITDGQATPLMATAQAGHADLVECLLRHGANPNSVSSRGWTSLMAAADNGRLPSLQALLAAKADVNIQNEDGRTALSYAIRGKYADCVTALLAAKADPNTNRVNLPLSEAAWTGNTAIAESLLRAGADPNRPAKSWTQLQEPGTTGQRYEPSPYGPYVALQIAVGRGDTAMVKLLLQYKADPNTSQPWYGPPSSLLFYALDKVDMFKALLDAGADSDAVSGGWSLLASAAKDKNADAVAALLAKGARVNLPPDSEHIPLIEAIETSKGGTNIVALLLNAKADVNVRASQRQGQTPLHIAARSDVQNVAVARLLLARGADPNVATLDEFTPLHFAVGSKNAEMVQLLLEHKADPNRRNNAGQTPLDYVKETTASGQMGIAAPLRSGPTRIQREPASPDQPASPASLAELLRQHGALDELPDFTAIRVTRQGLERKLTVFEQQTNGWNQFTLLETVLTLYRNQFGSRGPFINQNASEIMPFPDLTRLIVHRPGRQPGQKGQEITVNLLNSTNGVDCTRDIPLEFGDIVEIPLREHALNEPRAGLAKEQADVINTFLTGHAQLVIRGQKKELRLPPWAAYLSAVLYQAEAQSMLLTSSDLSRVKVTRKHPRTGKKTEFVVNVTPGISEFSKDLWLRDGDVIEVPEK